MKRQALLALGSNLENPESQIARANKSLQNAPEITVLRCASLYRSAPRGPQDQQSFINSATLIETTLSPLALLRAAQTIEQEFGRIKTRHWGERIIDIDIVFYDQEHITLSNPDLQIPHREALIRDFVMVPCLEIAPRWQLPNGSFLAEYLDHVEEHQLVKIAGNMGCS